MLFGLLGAGIFGGMALSNDATIETMDKHSISVAKGQGKLTYNDYNCRNRFIPTNDYCIIDGYTHMGKKDCRIIKEGKNGGRLGELLNVSKMYRDIACEEAKRKGIQYVSLRFNNISTPNKCSTLCYDINNNKYYIYVNIGAYELIESEKEKGKELGLWNTHKELCDKKIPVYVEFDMKNRIYKCGYVDERVIKNEKLFETNKSEIDISLNMFNEKTYMWRFDLIKGIELYNRIHNNIEMTGSLSDYYIESERNDLVQEYLNRMFNK